MTPHCEDRLGSQHCVGRKGGSCVMYRSLTQAELGESLSFILLVCCFFCVQMFYLSSNLITDLV